MTDGSTRFHHDQVTEQQDDELSRAAIVWKNIQQGGPKCDYWDLDSLQDFLLTSSSVLDPPDPTKDGSFFYFSYQSMLLLTIHVVNALRQKIQIEIVDSISTESPSDNKKPVIAVPVAVAIPEGPFLPLAILAVHALNVPFSIADKNEGEKNQAYAFLIPIEPGEGKDRIRHMLAETRPAIILCLEVDRPRLEQIVQSIPENNDAKESDESLHNTKFLQPKSPLIVDFASLARETTGAIRSEAHNHCQETVLEHLKCQLRGTATIQAIIEECIQILLDQESPGVPSSLQSQTSRISHVAYTSGSTGLPKGSISSIRSLHHYLAQKNHLHGVARNSTVLLASAVSFDPCLSDILATFEARATLGLVPRSDLSQNLPMVLQSLQITHVLCTPTLWSTMNQTATEHVVTPKDFPCLQVVALGGEPIPKQIVQTWARRQLLNHATETGNTPTNEFCRLFATYGVTEACVYQTMGEIANTYPSSFMETPRGQNVGKPFGGMHIRICSEEEQDKLVDVTNDVVSDTRSDNLVGEVVLHGSQVDEWSSYWKRPEQSRRKFVSEAAKPKGDDDYDNMVYYRTGDRGYIDKTSGDLVLLGRIGGEEGMIKINGVRVELGEIEAALVDDSMEGSLEGQDKQVDLPVIVNAAVVARRKGGTNTTELHAYCVLSKRCSSELGIVGSIKEQSGVLCNSNAMLTLLRTRCKEKVRAGCTPSVFVFVSGIPLSPTGKRSLAGLPALDECIPQESKDTEIQLRDFGTAGNFVAEQICSSLNLQPCQQSMLTTSASFSMLGGDSLAATRIARALYAHHHGINNSRHLGGKYGTIDGAFSAVHLIRASTLGDYVDFLDENGICTCSQKKEYGTVAEVNRETPMEDTVELGDAASQNESDLYDALLLATTQGQTTLSVGLLRAGSNPNWGDHGGRLGKVSGRNNRRAIFRSGPLHLASLKGDANLVQALLKRGAKFASPDASGSYPLHLAVSGENASQQHYTFDENQRRLKCVQLLLDAGAPILMKDGNKQTVLHCAARAGNCELIDYIMPLWKAQRGDRETRDSSIDWRDHWSRTAIHWAILNGHLDALRTLLKHGCNPDPPLPKENTKGSSMALESPLELCERLYGTTEGIGQEIMSILNGAKSQR